MSLCGDHNDSLPLPFGVTGNDPGALPEGIVVENFDLVGMGRLSSF